MLSAEPHLGSSSKPLAARAAWSRLLDHPALGRAWVAPHGPALVAYAVLTLGYSLEYRGRDAFVDELFVAPAWRGRGLGREALAILDVACVELEVNALHLEVERDKANAQALYRRWGFEDRERFLMTKRFRR